MLWMRMWWPSLRLNSEDTLKRRKNPYTQRLKKQVTLRLGVDVIEYFRALAKETGIPYQNLINLYLRECARTGKKPALSWAS